MNEPLANMLRYNRWATSRLLAALRDLDDATLDAKPLGDGRSIRQTLVHLVGSEQTFVLRTKGRQNEDEIRSRDPWPGIDGLEALSAAAGNELVAIAEALDEDVDVVLPYMGTRPVFPLSFFLVHAVEHGVEHRTEIKVMLKLLGIETPDLDGWFFAGAMGYGA
jgi:uncharacterized damage-inducible protein DinB